MMLHGMIGQRWLTPIVQLQPNEIKRAKRAHHKSAVCCNDLLASSRSLRCRLGLRHFATEFGVSTCEFGVPREGRDAAINNLSSAME